MLFVIDIGNTHTVAGIYHQGVVVKQWRVKTDPAMTADELGMYHHNLFAIAHLDITKVSGVIISSVVPQLEAAYDLCCNALFADGVKPVVLNVNCDTVADLIAIKLDNPAEVGADRLVNGIAAYQLCRGNAIIIDFGTAITFDCISAQCEYLGGLILPGLNVSLGALTRKAAKLPQIDISTPPQKVIGTSTVSAMKSGVLFGYGAMIEGLLAKVQEEMTATGYGGATVFATGGSVSAIRPFVPSIEQIEPNLTLDGLAFIYQKLRG